MANSIVKCPQCGGDKVVLTGTNQYECQYCGTTFSCATETTSQQPQSIVNRCPYCGGEILMGASKCRHCGEWLTRSAQAAPQPVNSQPTNLQQNNTPINKWRKITMICFMVVGVLCSIIYFFIGNYDDGIIMLILVAALYWLYTKKRVTNAQ